MALDIVAECDAHDCYNTLDLGGTCPEDLEEGLATQGWLVGTNEQEGFHYCPEHKAVAVEEQGRDNFINP